MSGEESTLTAGRGRCRSIGGGCRFPRGGLGAMCGEWAVEEHEQRRAGGERAEQTSEG